MMATKKKEKTLKVTLRKSVIGEKPKTRATVEGLGLRKMNQTVTQADTPSVRGMLARVRHLVEVEEA
jgi:large subunit ribosomal protein L30